MKSNLALCAESSAVDNTSNLLSVFNVIDEVTSPAYPTVIPKLTVLFIVEKEDGDHDSTDAFVTINLNETELIRQPMEIAFAGKKRMRQILIVNGLVINGPGKLTTKMIVGDDVIDSWEIYLIQSQSAQPNANLTSV